MGSQLLTIKLIENLQPRNNKYDVRDSRVTGFLVCVYPSGKKSYMVQYQRGKRITIAAVNLMPLARARDRAKAILGDVIQGKMPKEKQVEIALTVRQFLENEYKPWVETHQASSTRTVQKIDNAFKEYMTTPLCKLDLHSFEKWRSKKLETLSKATINRDVGAFKAMLSRAVAWGFLQNNPLENFKPLKEDVLSVVRYLSADEEHKLFCVLRERENNMRERRETANKWRHSRGYELLPTIKKGQYADHLRPMIEIALTTGLRWTELATLRKSQINLKQRFLSQIGKNGKTRYIPLNDMANKTLKTWLSQTSSEYVFPSIESPLKPITTVKTAWQKLLQEAGINNFRWHDLRHHFASKLVMAGVDLNTVRELLGHTDIKMTLRYAHLAPEYKAEALSKLTYADFV